jgi:hypothetical protein
MTHALTFVGYVSRRNGRSLPALAKQYVLRTLFLDFSTLGPIPAHELNVWVKSDITRSVPPCIRWNHREKWPQAS